MGSFKAFFHRLSTAFNSFDAATTKLTSPKILRIKFGHYSFPSIIDPEDLTNLKSKVRSIQAALGSADELSTLGAFDQHWMRELRDLQHHAEDVLEEIEFESNLSKLEEFNYKLHSVNGGKRKREEVIHLFSSSPLENLNGKIEKIMERYNEIAFDREALRIDNEEGEKKKEMSPFPASTSMRMGKLHGRGEDFQNLRGSLFSHNSNTRSYDVISLVGMPGIGKTALLQHLCNHKEIKDHFNLSIWICASHDFDVTKITREIMQHFPGENTSEKNLGLLQSDLARCLTGKRILLVIDDVWIGNKMCSAELKAHWESLLASLNGVTKGSKVLLATQDTEVAKISRSDYKHTLSELSDNGCWLICKGRANTSISEPDRNELTMMCKGLPVAAKAFGDFLHSEQDGVNLLRGTWWASDIPLNEILSLLKTSYNRLPPYLKRCFAYCSLFPKGYIFEKQYLVQLWVGQGFVEPHDEQLPEDVGRGYFDQLVGKCLFRPIDDIPCKERFVMNDFLHELAQSMAFKEILRINGQRLFDIDEKVRHLSLVPPESDSESLVECELTKEKYLRSFLFINESQGNLDRNPFCVNILNKLFSLIKSLRVLDLSYTNLKELPISFIHLIHLRYLSLAKTKIEKLPESICGLFNLRTLDLKHCDSLIELPHGIKYLSNLHKLELPKKTSSVIFIPCEIGELTSLRKCPVFVIGSAHGSCGIGELGKLENLEEDLLVIGVNNVRNEKLAKKALLRNKLKIRKLALQWSGLEEESTNLNPNSVLSTFEGLQPNEDLRELVIIGYPGLRFPNWLGECMKIQCLRLEGLRNLQNFELLSNLSRLERLEIYYCKQLRKIKNLCFLDSLQEFIVVSCPVLYIKSDEKLPINLRVVNVGADCAMLSRWNPYGFEEIASRDEVTPNIDFRALVRLDTGIEAMNKSNELTVQV